jgi:hypothetical protein
MADTTVGRGIGGALVGVAQAGAMDAATLAVMDTATLEDTPGAAVVEASMVQARSTVVGAFMAEAGSTAVAVDMVADIGNRLDRQK